jgi:hypothetical protein
MASLDCSSEFIPVISSFIYGRLAFSPPSMLRIAEQAKFNKFFFGLFIIVLCITVRVFRAPEFVAAFCQKQFNAGTVALTHYPPNRLELTMDTWKLN